MTKKETELFDGLVTLVKQSMEVQKEILVTLQHQNAPLIQVQNIKDLDMKPGPIIERDLPPAADEPPAPVIPEPKKYTIEDCRLALGNMVEKLGEPQAWAYLKTFNVDMLPDLDPTKYAELVQGAERQLA